MPNRSGNDGTITRFGWKAQNKSVVIFAGEAYNVEMGVTNDVFPTSTDETRELQPGEKRAERHHPHRHRTISRNQGFNNPLHILPDWLEFAIFMRQLAPPATGAVLAERPARAATVRHGRQQSRGSAAFFATRR